MATSQNNSASVPALHIPRTGYNLEPLLLGLLFIAIFAGFQGGRYYLANRLQELGIAAALCLFFIGAWRGLFLLKQGEWRCWVIRPMMLVFGIMITSALVFVVNFEGKFLYSFFSAREFLLAFVGPGIYLLVRCGLSTQRVEHILWLALAALMVNYLYFYFSMDLRATYFSSDHTVSNLVTYGEWRGFRLKPPLFAIMVALLASICLLFQATRATVTLGAIAIVGLAIYIWSIVLFRSTLATMLLSVLLYPLLLAQRNRLQVALVLAPLVLVVMPLVVQSALAQFSDAYGGNIRTKAFGVAMQHIPHHFLLGAGEDSAYGESYQDLVAPYFYPSDLGLVGTFYKYGLLGILLYLFMHGKIWLTLWQGNLDFKLQHGHHNSLLWALLIFMTAQTFNLALNPGLAYAQGITLGSVALALGSLHIAKNSHN